MKVHVIRIKVLSRPLARSCVLLSQGATKE
jgi:hypothetical protein